MPVGQKVKLSYREARRNDLGADEVFDTHTIPEFQLFALNGPFR
jgi:hypothetical protein